MAFKYVIGMVNGEVKLKICYETRFGFIREIGIESEDEGLPGVWRNNKTEIIRADTLKDYIKYLKRMIVVYKLSAFERIMNVYYTVKVRLNDERTLYITYRTRFGFLREIFIRDDTKGKLCPPLFWRSYRRVEIIQRG